MFRRSARLCLLTLLPWLLCCVPARAQNAVMVAAAADLAPVLPPLLDSFHRQTGVLARATYGSSASLAAQIEHGAPFDLFLSADMGLPQKLAGDGFGAGQPPVAYAQGALVLWSRNDSPLRRLSVDTLRDPALASLAIANPEHAPYGQAAVAALRSLGVYTALQPKLRIAENIAQAAEFAESGAAQAGLLSLTSALTPRLQSEGRFVLLPAGAYPPIRQGALVLKGGGNATAAQALLRYLQSSAVRGQLAARGLQPPR